MGVCMAPEVRREIKQIKEIYHKTCELKQSKRVLVVGATGSGKSELIDQAISTNNSYSIIDEYLEFQYPMGPFTISERAHPEHSLRAWEYRDDILSWDTTLSYYPPIYEDSESQSSLDPFVHEQFDFDLLITGFTRATCGIQFAPKIQSILDSYYPRPGVKCKKDEIIDDNMVEFWEISSFDHAFWTFCLKQIVAIVFVVDVSCFDEFYYDPVTYTKSGNKMSETINQFRQMIHHKMDTAFFVILNKMDTFQQKVSRGTSIKICPEFSGFEGDSYDVAQCITHIKNVFDDANHESERLVYFHETCAVLKDGSDLNLLGTIDENSSSDTIKTVWHKFGQNLNYHWNILGRDA
eukprot:220380_1